MRRRRGTPTRAMPRREAGFALIEVVAAATIGGLSLAALLTVFTDGGARADYAAEKRLAAMVAQSALAAAGTDGPLVPGAVWNGFDQGLAWTVQVSQYAAGDRNSPAPPLLRIDTAVGRPGGSAALASLATLRLALPSPPVFNPDAPDGSTRRQVGR